MNRSLIPIVGLMLLTGLLLIGALIFMKPPAKPLPVMGSAPAFELTDRTGATFSSQELKDRIWVADFFFTRCPGPCPKMAENMKSLYREFTGESAPLFVSITVDPENDTPETLAKYARKHGVADKRWRFLTGEADTLHGLAVEGFKIGNPDQLILHSQKFVLVDGEGKVRGYYDGVDAEEIEELRRDLKRLL